MAKTVHFVIVMVLVASSPAIMGAEFPPARTGGAARPGVDAEAEPGTPVDPAVLALTRLGADLRYDPQHQLVGLKLSGLRFTNFTMVNVKGFEHLRSFALHNTYINRTGISHLGGLSDITSLELTGHSVTDVGLEKLAGLYKLVRLDLDRTRVTDVGLVHLSRFVNL